VGLALLARTPAESPEAANAPLAREVRSLGEQSSTRRATTLLSHKKPGACGERAEPIRRFGFPVPAGVEPRRTDAPNRQTLLGLFG